LKIRGEAAVVWFVLFSSNASPTKGVTRKGTVREICTYLVQVAWVGIAAELAVDGNPFFTGSLLSLIRVSTSSSNNNIPSNIHKTQHRAAAIAHLKASMA
jgi:hypothetical protein